MKYALSLFTSVVFLSCASSLTYAQMDNAQVSERMDRLEHDLMLLQRQIAQGGSASAPSAAALPANPADAGNLEVRLSAMEEDMRNLRGQMEQNQFQIRKVSDTLDKFQHDTEFRFGELAKAPAPMAAAAATPVKTEDKAPAATPAANTDNTLHPPAADAAAANAGAADQPLKTEFTSPRDHYNYAFRLLNQTQYAEAAASFDAFIKKYPKDPLVGNAWYWEGETYYIRRDYVNAADDFRQGFEALPNGPKAADNLYKLALSLNALNRDKEACVVLQQVVAKYPKATTVIQKAEQEIKRIGCQ